MNYGVQNEFEHTWRMSSQI